MDSLIGCSSDSAHHDELNDGQAHISAAKPQAQEQTRLPRPHEDEGRSQGVGGPPPARTAEAVRPHRLQVTPPEDPGSGEPGRVRLRLGRARRITDGVTIRGLLRRGKRSETAHLDVIVSPSPAVRSRVAIVVPKHGRTIAARNRLKRRLREIVRTELLPRLDAGGPAVDLLVRARGRAYHACFAELREELVGWIDRRWRDASRSP